MTITGGTVTVTGSNVDDSYGICPGTHGGNKITISGGHVTAMGKPALYVDKNLYGALDLSGYTNYQWRTSESGDFTTTPYTYDSKRTYVEIDKASTVINGNETADFVNDAATALDLITNNTPGKATWNSATNTLTLKGVNFTTFADTAVQLPAGSTIVLAEGTKNAITSTFESASDNTFSYGILVEGGDLTIEGGGQLAVKGGTAQYSDGIYVSHGILAIESGTVTATGGTAKAGSYGIYTDRGVIINGGTVTATGSKSEIGSHGIATSRDVTITGGTVIARGGNGGQASYGINTGNSYACTVTGGDVTAIGGNASERSYGIDSRQYITISGGHVTAQTLGDATYRFALHCAPDLSAYTGYYWRTGPDDYYYNTAYPYSEAHTYVEFAPEGKLAPDTADLDDLPRTGDNSNVLLWIALLLASGLGVTGAVVYGRRSKTAK